MKHKEYNSSILTHTKKNKNCINGKLLEVYSFYTFTLYTYYGVGYSPAFWGQLQSMGSLRVGHN